MVTVVKWLAATLLAGFVLLIANIVDEYFRPYRRRS